MVDAAVNVALFGFDDGALEPWTRAIEVAGTRIAVAHLMKAGAQVGVVDTAMDIAFFRFGDGTLKP